MQVRLGHFDASARSIRWIVLVLILLSFPFSNPNGLAVLTLVTAGAILNAGRYPQALLRLPLFGSRTIGLVLDQVLILTLVLLSGGLASPYYSLFLLPLVAIIAFYGVAGFAFVLGAQATLAALLLHVPLAPLPAEASAQLVIHIVILVVIAFMLEQLVRHPVDDYLIPSGFTHRIENDRQRLLVLINSLSSAVLAIDSAGKVYLYNAAALEFLNTNRDITGTPAAQLLPLRDRRGRKVNLMHLLQRLDRPANRQDLLFEPGDDSKMVLDLTLSPVHVPGLSKPEAGGYMAVFRDITKEKSLDEQRAEFISVASHELRTPLAIAEANLSTALLPGYAKIDAKAKDLLRHAHDNLVFLSELIEDLTTLARAERGDLKTEAELVRLADLAQGLARDYRAQAEAKKLQFHLEITEDPGQVVTSERELREIMQNFLTNAIKYTEKGSVTLAVERRPDGALFSVRDTGIGISTSDKPKLFQKFYRVESFRTRKTRGTGLGLYITHKLAEKLGATVSFTSRLNQGSTFSVLLPTAQAPHED
jgi:signal transduction histidine kinase